jgi:orc1/cdc6 family replication initiation protein
VTVKTSKQHIPNQRLVMKSNIISNTEPLQPEHIPSKFIDRKNTKTALKNLLGKNSSRNIHIQGKTGTGKTHLTQATLNQLPSEINTCTINCQQANTQYKTLKQIYQALTGEKIKSGYHTSTLQRKIEERTGAIHTVIVLDEIDFLLQNKGEDLLYFLSRIENNTQINIITISSQIHNLRNQLEERTYSSLQPYPLQLERYTGKETYNILHHRAQKALKPQTLQQKALTYIASKTTNIRLALQWLKTAAQNTDNVITENTVEKTEKPAQKQYTAQLLDKFTEHHHLTFQAIQELHTEQETVQAGDVYQRYQELCTTYNKEPLTNRRISDYIKTLELLNLIQAEYHYGGKTGKTRNISLNYQA